MAFGSILLAALGIGLLIFLHELGHFLAARLAGVRVEVFSLGFGPRLWGRRWGDTDFRLSAVPFGGYVMVAGQDPSDDRYPEEECLYAKSIGQRALFWSGGVLMNVLVALVLFPIVFRAGVDFQAPIVGRIDFGGAAWEAGLQHGDRIVAVGDKSVLSFENLAVEIALAGGKPLPLRVTRGETTTTVTVLPQWNSGGGRYDLGIGPPAVDELPRLEVDADSAAAAAGLQTGDELLAVDGQSPRGAQVHTAVHSLLLPTAAPIAVRIRRDGNELDKVLQPTPTAKPTPPRIGIGLLSRRVRALRQPSALLDRQQRVAGRAFLGGDLAVVASGTGDLVLHVVRDGAERTLSCPLSAEERLGLADLIALEAGDGLLIDPTPGLPAAQAGLRPGDRIVAIDGQRIEGFPALQRAIERARQSRVFRVARRGDAAGTAWFDPVRRDLLLDTELEVRIAPSPQPQYETGVLPKLRERTEEVRAESLGAALAMGGRLSLDLVKQLYVTMKRMVTGDVGAKNMGGIIRISQVSYQAAQRGWTWFLYLMGMLSLNLAFVNLLPIPVLDGGHLLFLLIEKVKGSPVSARVFGYSQMLGLVFVLMLVLFVTYNDIMQLF
jgi:regulator of sigma E protease